MKNLIDSSATDIIQKIKSGQTSVVAVVSAFLEQIKKHNPQLNAIFNLRNEKEILDEARQKDHLLASGQATGLLFGLPMTVKDNFFVSGLKTSNGNPQFRNYVATYDAELVKRLKNAGVIILGKTNVPLLSIDWQSTNFWNGQTNNPYDPNRVPGGSSGGSAVSVASGFCALELGSNSGGSIRVPSHFCGICGLRPTENALPNRGHLKQPNRPQGQRHLTVPGPMAKNVDDLMLAMKVLWDNKNYPLAEIPNVDFESSSWNGEKLQVAVSESINHVEIDKEYLAIFRGFIDLVKADNHTLAYSSPVYDEHKAYLTCGELTGFEFGINMPRIPLSRALIYWFIRLKYRDANWAKGIARGATATPRQYAKTLNNKDAVSDVYHSFLTGHDVWITPVCAVEAFCHQNAGKPFVVNGKQVGYTEAIASYTFTTALSGHPIVVIPIGRKTNGMPVGVQIHSRRWSDKRLLEIARRLESLVTQHQASQKTLLPTEILDHNA